uniref:Calponin-homology (CH) domain-containing protein n=1 Tax=Setaria digitata TaxID=48799 RepID=A0A915Q6C8_9BILA
MTETETVTTATDEASKIHSPMTENKPPVSVNSNEDIPAVDADVKDSDTAELKKVEVNEKVPEPQKDPREDPVGWVNSLIPGAVHKVNYRLLDWAQQLAIEEVDKRQALPGKSDSVTKNQFLSFLRDGSLLAKLANRLQPGSIETIHEGDAAKDKNNQASNINAFINFVKDKVGLSEEQLFTAADLQEKGKAGYQAVFNTLMQLALKAQGIFQQKGIDPEQLVQIASQVVPTNLIQTVLNFFRRARPTQTPKKLAKEAEDKDKAAAAAAAAEKVLEEKQIEEEVCKKVDSQAGVDTPAVAVH